MLYHAGDWSTPSNQVRQKLTRNGHYEYWKRVTCRVARPYARQGVAVAFCSLFSLAAHPSSSFPYIFSIAPRTERKSSPVHYRRISRLVALSMIPLPRIRWPARFVSFPSTLRCTLGLLPPLSDSILTRFLLAGESSLSFPSSAAIFRCVRIVPQDFRIPASLPEQLWFFSPDSSTLACTRRLRSA